MRSVTFSTGTVTPATVVKAACILMVAQRSACKDVVIGELVRGRNCSVPDIDQVSAVCANVIPVRVKILQGMTARDLLDATEANQLTCMPFENLGTEDIIRHAAPWPQDACLELTVNYVRRMTDSEGGRDTVGSDAQGYWDLVRIDQPHSFEKGLHLEVHPVDRDLMLGLTFCDEVVSHTEAEILLGDIEGALRVLLGDPRTVVQPAI